MTGATWGLWLWEAVQGPENDERLGGNWSEEEESATDDGREMFFSVSSIWLESTVSKA